MKRILCLALVLATLIKLYLAFFTQGSFDVLLFQGHLANVQKFGVSVYHTEGYLYNPFNHPPPMIHLMKFWGWLSQSGIPFRFWLRLSSILADIGSFFLLWHWLRNHDRDWLLLALALCPASILISGFHGNTDPLMIFLTLLSIYLIGKNSRWAGVVFGLAVGVKIMPLIFGPAVFFHLTWRKRVEFFGLACATFLACSLPYILQDPKLLASVFGYGGVYGDWGFTLLAYVFSPEPPSYAIHHGVVKYGVQGVHAGIAQILKLITIALALVVPFHLRNEKLFVQCGFVTAIVLFFAPGFGYQYLAWLVPFVLLAGLRMALVYYLTTGIYLSTIYICYATQRCLSPVYPALMAFACWLAILKVLITWRRKIQMSMFSSCL
jgi:hypothetical protein